MMGRCQVSDLRQHSATVTARADHAADGGVGVRLAAVQQLHEMAGVHREMTLSDGIPGP